MCVNAKQEEVECEGRKFMSICHDSRERVQLLAEDKNSHLTSFSPFNIIHLKTSIFPEIYDHPRHNKMLLYVTGSFCRHDDLILPCIEE